MAFVDVTGVVDADTDGIVFEGKPLERPIIPRFVVPKNLARRLAKLTEGDALEIENQRRAGNANIEFDENKLRSLLGEIDGKPEQLGDARSASGLASMRSIRERVPLSNVLDDGTDEDDPDYEELDNWRRSQFWTSIRDELEQKILSMGEWTPVQKKRIEQQTYLLVNNLKQMREAWQSMGRRERTGLLRRKTVIDGFESHPDIDLTIEDIVNQSELRIHDDGTISLRLPPNKILRSLLPGERDYHNTELPDGKVLGKIIDDIGDRSNAGQWKDLVDSTFRGGNSRNANLAKWPGNGERLPFHDLFTKKYIEQLKTDYRAGTENAIMLRANEVAAKLLKYYIIPELEKINRNQNARVGGLNKDPDEFIHGYLHLLSDPHAWRAVHEEMENRGYLLSPLIVFHDILGHYALGNAFDRHGEWGNILASLSFARDKDFWDRLRQIPGLEDLTEEDREIYLRATLSEVAAAWIQRAIKPPSKVGELPSETEIQQIARYLRDYDGPIDEVIDRLDPPSRQGMKSTRSIPLSDASEENLGKIAFDSVEGISIRERLLSGITSARSSRALRRLSAKRNRRKSKNYIPPIIGEKYKIVKSSDGVHYAEDISSRDVFALRSGDSKPPKLPFFAPVGGGNNMETGEGYYFSTTGKRYWGKYGAAGALLRRKNKDGEYEYFLARRSRGLSTGGGRWAFPGGAHKDRDSSQIPGQTAMEEFKEEVGGDISALKPVATYKDQVAPDWAYDTYVFDVGQDEFNDLEPTTDETSEVGWFTADEVLKMADDGKLHNSFGRAIEAIFEQTGETTERRKGMDSGRSATWKNLILDDFDDGMTVDELVEKYGRDKKEILSILNLGDSGTDDGESRRTGMPSTRTRRTTSKLPSTQKQKPEADVESLSDDDIDSLLDENVKALKELDDLLDSGEINLEEYRKRQSPLRKEGARIGAEKQRRSGKPTKPSTQQTEGKSSEIKPGKGMIERDERGNPTKWDGKKFLAEQAEKRRKMLVDMGFSPQEVDALLGIDSTTRTGGLYSTRALGTKPNFKLTPTNFFVKKVNSRKTGGVPEFSEWADREIANALQMYDFRAPRDWDTQRGSFIPSWFPSRDSLIQELNHRGYDVYLGNSGSRRYNDLVFIPTAKDNATFDEMRRRIWTPSGRLGKLITDKEEETGQAFPMKSKIQRWDFGAQIASISDAELRAMDVEFDRERTNKLADVRSGVNSKEQFNNWYEREFTPLRRVLSAELTRRQVRAAIDEKRTIDAVFPTGISAKEYAFIAKDPALFSRAAGMLSRRNARPTSDTEKRILSGEITENDIAFIQRYHDLKDSLENQLIEKLTDLFGTDPDEVDWDSLDIATKQRARALHEEWMRKLSTELSRLGDDGDRTPAELEDLGFDQGEVDDLMSGRAGGMESKKRKRKMTQRWTDEEKRAFSEQRLRSKKIPKKRKQGPASNEWSERRAGREIKSTTRVSGEGSQSGRLSSYYESLANQYFSGVAEFIGDDTRVINSRYNENLPMLGEPFATVRVSKVSDLKKGDILPDGFDSKEMFSTADNPRYVITSISGDGDGFVVFSARDLRTGELATRKVSANQKLPNVVRPAPENRAKGMSSARTVNDVKLHSRLTQQFRMEQFDEIASEFEGLISELNSIDAQIKLLEKNMERRAELGLPDDGLSEVDDKRWTQLESARSAIEDRVDQYVKFAEFVAAENIQRRRHKNAVAVAKKRIADELQILERPYGRWTVFEAPDLSVIDLVELGATTEEIRDIMDNLDIDDADMDAVFVAGRPPFTGTRLAKRLDEIVSGSKGLVIGPEFDEYDKDDEDEIERVNRLASNILKSAAADVARSKSTSEPTRTIIEATASDMALPSGATGLSSSKTPMGKGLGVSRVIYPNKNKNFIAKDIAFVSYDANRQELTVGYKDESKFIFGGIGPDFVDSIEGGERTLIASINAAKKDARYRINPDGSTVGKVPSTSQFLKRDMERLNLSGDDLEIAESVIEDLTRGRDDLTRKMRSERRQDAIGLAFGLADNNEYAMAFNIIDALDEIDRSTPGAGYMPNGMRSYAQTRHPRFFVGLSQDEIGEIRDEIASILKKHKNNFTVNYGLSKYDDNLAGSQKRSGRGELVLLETEYNAIMDAYEELAKIDPDWKMVVGPHPVEMAAVSKDGRFDTEKFKSSGDFAGKLINNGAPQDITVGEQKELINWARRQPGFRIVQSIVASHDDKGGNLTANQWTTLRSLYRNFGKNQYRAGVESNRSRRGMLSASDDEGRAMDAVGGNPMGQFIPFGADDGDRRSRSVSANADLKGRTVQDAIPAGLSNEEQLALIEEIGQYSPKTNPDGIRGKDYVERRTALLDLIAGQKRLDERRAALERAKQSGQIGDDVNLPAHLEFWPLVSEDTKSKLNKAAERKYGMSFIDLEPQQMEDVLVFETGASGYYSGGTFKKIKKRPDAIEMEDWERLLLPIHERVGEIEEEENTRRETRKLEQASEPSLEELLSDPDISPERKARIEKILEMKREASARWQASRSAANASRRGSGREISLDRYESIDELGPNARKNAEVIAKSKYKSDFASLDETQKRDVLDSYAKEKFGIEHYRKLESEIQRSRSRAERQYQQARIDGEHLAAWDQIAEVLEGPGGPTITRGKLDALKEAIDGYPSEQEDSTDSEMALIGKIEELSSAIEAVELAYDDEGIDIPSGRNGGMSSRSSFTPSGIEIDIDEDGQNERNTRTGMSSIFGRRGSGSATAEVEEPKKKAPAAPVRKQPIDTSTWKKFAGQGGSNPGGFFQDANGVRYYVKTPPSTSHIESEVLAAELYKLLGIGVPEISAGTYKGRPNVVSKLIDEPSSPVTGARGDGSKEWQRKVTDGFIADAWLANWDAILNDNVRMDKNGEPIRVDNGGSMKWRAQGGPKGAAFGDEVGELDSLRTKSPAAPVYRTVTPEQIKEQVKNLKSVSPDTIRALVESIMSDKAEAKELSDRLIARRQNILDKFDRSGGMLSTNRGATPIFGSSQFMNNLPQIINNSSNEELMQMWDMTRPFVNLGQFQMNENAKNMNVRIEQMKKDIRNRIKTEVSLRSGSGDATGDARKASSAARQNNSVAERRGRAEAIQQTLAGRANSIKTSYSAAGLQEDQHTAIWDDLSEIMTGDGDVDLTPSKLDSMIEEINKYIEDNKKVSRSEQQANVRQAIKLRDALNEVSETYASDPYIQDGDNSAKPSAGRTVGRKPSASADSPTALTTNRRGNKAPTMDIARYVSARANKERSQGMTSSTKAGRAEVRGEAVFFKSIQDMLAHEAGKADDPKVGSALRMLKTIMERQKSGLISDRRTNAGAIYLTEDEINDILDALMVALDRQTERGNADRSKMLADFADLLARAAMSTFIDKSVPEINSRTVKKINSEGREVEIALNE